MRLAVAAVCVCCLATEFVIVTLSKFHYTVDILASLLLVSLFWDSRTVDGIAGQRGIRIFCHAMHSLMLKMIGLPTQARDKHSNIGTALKKEARLRFSYQGDWVEGYRWGSAGWPHLLGWSWLRLCGAKNAFFVRHFFSITAIILPRQARDKHKETLGNMAFSAGVRVSDERQKEEGGVYPWRCRSLLDERALRGAGLLGPAALTGGGASGGGSAGSRGSELHLQLAAPP
jgi:hypothetical protein